MEFMKKFKHFLIEKQLGLMLLFGSILGAILLGYFCDINTTEYLPLYMGKYGITYIRNPHKTSPQEEVDKLLGIKKGQSPEEREAAIKKTVDKLVKMHKEKPEESCLKTIAQTRKTE